MSQNIKFKLLICIIKEKEGPESPGVCVFTPSFPGRSPKTLTCEWQPDPLANCHPESWACLSLSSKQEFHLWTRPGATQGWGLKLLLFLCPPLALLVPPWTSHSSHFTSLRLSFLFCKTEAIIPNSYEVPWRFKKWDNLCECAWLKT